MPPSSEIGTRKYQIGNPRTSDSSPGIPSILRTGSATTRFSVAHIATALHDRALGRLHDANGEYFDVIGPLKFLSYNGYM
ncbi:hypothetical protein BJ165DRAFT_1508807 [Panaeolus papilionaceus]|nr:hypothetical protein BJ165DRAFT_1508807 [Panaeolus papilionaceus]